MSVYTKLRWFLHDLAICAWDYEETPDNGMRRTCSMCKRREEYRIDENEPAGVSGFMASGSWVEIGTDSTKTSSL